MHRNNMQQHHESFIEELEKALHGKEQGYIKKIKVGQKLFPFSLPPQLEIILLDPEDKTIVFRPTTSPDSTVKKKGEWRIGKPINAVKYVIDWADTMRKTIGSKSQPG